MNKEEKFETEQFQALAAFIIEKENEIREKYPISVVIPENVKAFEEMYERIVRLFRNQEDVAIEKHIHTPDDNMGFIRVKGQSLDIKNTLLFSAAIGVDNIIEIYAKTDGAIWMDITVHNLTKIIKG